MKKFFRLFQSLSLLRKIALYVITCLPILVLAHLFFSDSASVQKDFIPAFKIVEKSLLEKVVRENHQNTGIKLDPQRIKALQVSGKGRQKLYIFDFNNQQLCGMAGCLYAAYTPEGVRVLNIYLRPYLPKFKTLFTVDRQKTSDGFPCLILSQLQDTSSLSLRQYCYLSSSKAFIEFNQYSESLLK
ncbi:MAG: hypothetical protein Fur006_56480 [Coleofasciculaceae cyanobacterium]